MDDEVAMKHKTWVHAVVLGAILTVTGCTKDSGMPRNTLPTPEETVTAYCDLDANGMRLTSATWKKVLPYISWSEEAGFDRAIVISGFSIGKAQKKNDQLATVTVEYRIIGVVSGDYTAGRRTEMVPFTVARTDRGWKIVEPDFMPPHVLAKVMVKHLEGTKQSEAAEKVKNDT
jgi:hypothetical protein